MCESIGHRPLRGRCPASPLPSFTTYLGRARVPLTIYRFCGLLNFFCNFLLMCDRPTGRPINRQTHRWTELYQFFQQNLITLGTNFRQIGKVIKDLSAKQAFVPFLFLPPLLLMKRVHSLASSHFQPYRRRILKTDLESAKLNLQGIWANMTTRFSDFSQNETF